MVLFFDRLRKRTKGIIIVVCVAFALGLLYVGGSSMINPNASIPVVAEVNGDAITSLELDRRYLSLVNFAAQLGQSITRAQEADLRFSALQDLVDQRLMLQAARRERIRVDNRLVNEEFNALQEMYGDQFNAMLRMQGLNQATLRELIRDSLLLEKVREEKSRVVVTDEEVRRAFDQEREEIQVRHILIDPAEEELGGDWDAARARAEEVLERLIAGEAFEDLAQRYSADPGSKDQGGDLGYIRRDTPFVQEFLDAAFALEVGELTGPVRSVYGYHIIQVTDRRLEEPDRPFEEVEAELRARLEWARGQEQFDAWLEMERSKARVVINEPRLRAIQLARAGLFDQAIEQYRQAIAADPFDGYLHYRLALLLEEVGAVDEALEAYAQAANTAATDPFLWFALGSAHQEQGNFEEAKEAYVNASELSPSNYQLHQYLARAFRDMGYDELADEEYAKSEEIQQQLFEEFLRQQEALQRQQELERMIEESLRQDVADSTEDGEGDPDGGESAEGDS